MKMGKRKRKGSEWGVLACLSVFINTLKVI
nr:MAG TPA: hypothetical protein [Caudoviricetes sp.]DAS01748.1 MAG TPA: hypothetical protein [Caudoviricetes sp.]